jgi:hypothetical protein
MICWKPRKQEDAKICLCRAHRKVYRENGGQALIRSLGPTSLVAGVPAVGMWAGVRAAFSSLLMALLSPPPSVMRFTKPLNMTLMGAPYSSFRPGSFSKDTSFSTTCN